jgi:hypothetical protein
MIRRKSLWLVLGLMATLSLVGQANDNWAYPVQPSDSAIWFFDNTVGIAVTGLHIEFDQEVEFTHVVGLGGDMMLVQSTGTSFDFFGEFIPYGTFMVQWKPADAVPSLVMWMSGERPVGKPFFTTIAKLGYLFGQGIVHLREADPAGLAAAFNQFFLDNAEYLATLSASLGMSLADSLMPIILDAPAEGIENFFNTIVGMLGVTTLDGVLEGGINFSALFVFLGL